MNLLELSEQEIIGRNSMEQLRQMGIEPYPAAGVCNERIFQRNKRDIQRRR